MASAVERQQNSRPQSSSDRLGHIDDKWPEVMFINDYAVFIGYLSMAVTGTGFLVLTWSTVVLLGGFVTMLAKKDFWCLTVITLVQTRVFDVFLNGNISYIGYSFKRSWEAALSIALPQNPFHQKWSARSLIRVLVFTVVLCPLFALYMFGLFVSPAISLWRLLQQDYGDMAGDRSKANLKPALVVLYSLALFQGVLFYYRAISSLEEQRLVSLVAQKYGLAEDDKARGSISDYLRMIRVGCEKYPSFARGRNLITYAASLMLSDSPDSYLSGARIIDTLIKWFSSVPDQSLVESQRMLMSNMIIESASFIIMMKFFQMLDSKGQSADSKEKKLRAMRIVAHFASQIRLDNMPQQCIPSFLDSPEASDPQHKETSIDILKKLTDNEENLRLLSYTKGLALKIIKLLALSDDRKHPDTEHHRWSSSIALLGIDVIKRFTSGINESSYNMRLAREISENTDALNILQSMLDCDQCKVEEELQKSVIVVLTQVTTIMAISLPVGDEVKKRFINSLIKISPYGVHNESSVQKLAGESLAQLYQIDQNKFTILDGLIQVIRDKNSEYRKSAADILRHLCTHIHYTMEESRFREVKDTMIDAILEVLREVLGCVEELVLPDRPTPLPTTAIWHYSYIAHNVEEHETLLSLCATVHARLISQDPDLVTRFDREAEEICSGMKMAVMTFADLMKKAADIVVASKRYRAHAF